MKAKTSDDKFYAGEKVTEHLVLSKARRIGSEAKRVNVEFPIATKLNPSVTYDLAEQSPGIGFTLSQRESAGALPALDEVRCGCD